MGYSLHTLGFFVLFFSFQPSFQSPMPKYPPLPKLGAFLSRIRQEQSSRNVQERAVELYSTAGYRLQCRLFHPFGVVPKSGVVLCPPFEQGIQFYQRWDGVIHAHRIAALKYAVLAIDPAGCGDSWGEDDKGGTEHQDNLQQAISWLSDHCSTLGILSSETGLSMALGGVLDDRIQWLIDIDGLIDPEMIRERHPTLPSTHTFWKHRDPSKRMSNLNCPYIRIQSSENIQNLRRILHQIPTDNIPFFQLNGYPRNHIPDMMDEAKLSTSEGDRKH